MKVQSDYFRRKQSKKGIALSTAMAICIVLALLVAVLVSMATLNITTTQSTISQREAYIQAKSALAFVESYYSQNDVPGKGKDGESNALFIFKDDVISNGADVYVTRENGTSKIDTAKIEELKKNCKDTYVDVVNQGKYLDLTAHCKYGKDNFYELAKEFNTGGSNESKLPYWEGNLKYTPTSDTRYLRIHVRTNPAVFKNKEVTGTDQAVAPFLYTWYTSVNSAQDDGQYGKSSTVNKMSDDKEDYPTISNGKWGDQGPEGNCAMTYEGNGWYVTEVKVAAGNNVHFVNAIVTKAKATRSKGNNQQSWELFGIPLPDDTKTGAGNGMDVYITLNRNELRDARNYNGGSTDDDAAPHDEFTHTFEDCSSSLDEFAKFCGSWYTVYTKKDTSTMHYRKQGIYDNSANPGGGFEYEGYGWWRRTVESDHFGDKILGYTFGSAYTVSENEYGKEIVKEGFVCEFSDGTKKLCDSEADANYAFADKGEGKRAGEYLTVNVKSSRQPVDNQVPTEIKYKSEWDKGSTPATVLASPANEELEFQELKSEGSYKEFALIGSADEDVFAINNWGRDENSDDNRYENIKKFKFTQTGTGVYEYRLKNCKKYTYQFKVIELLKDSGSIDKAGWAAAFGNATDANSDGNTIVYENEIPKDGCTMVITFNENGNTTSVSFEEGELGDYAVYGWCNDWGKRISDTEVYTEHNFAATNKMTYDEDTGKFVYTVSDSKFYVSPKQEISFKIVRMTADSGEIPDNAEFFPTNEPDNNFKFTAPDEDKTYIVTITFDPDSKKADAKFDEVPEGGFKKQYYFYNGKNKDEQDKDTEFSGWSDIYLTVIKNGMPEAAEKVEFTAGTTMIPINVPEDADAFYLSNMDSADSSVSGYQRTKEIPITTPSGVTLIPTTNGGGSEWEYYYPGGNIEEISGTGTMVYTGSVQTNYYDAPLVKVLCSLVPGSSGHYAFAAYPYPDYEVGGDVGTVKFDAKQYVTYQGEKYYYVSTNGYSGKYSFLIVKDSHYTKGGILLENHMALETDVHGGLQTKMNNRGGGVFTSEPQYYTATDAAGTVQSSELFNYSGYTPSWYTYKVPVTDEVKIVSITGVVSDGETIVNNGNYITPAKATDYYTQPLYISQEYANTSDNTQKIKYYTYNTNIGSVDTNEKDEVSIYFANDNGEFSEVAVYAYDPVKQSDTQTLSIDTTDADHSYYKYSYEAGQYCYFIFFDPTTSSDGSVENAAKKTDILYLTGNENTDTHEYDILAYNNNSKVFSPYVHPKTLALYTAIALESAVQASRVPERYSYNAATGEYKEINTLLMKDLVSKAESARNYAEKGSGGKWTVDGSADYTDNTKAVQEFVTAIQNARIYISEEVPDKNPTSTNTKFEGSENRVFKEGSYRDNTFQYQTRWVNALVNVYDNAKEVFDTNILDNDGKVISSTNGANRAAQTNPDKLRDYAEQINALIAYPLLDPSSKAVSIAVCDKVIPQTDDDGNVIANPGGWGKSNIHIYNLAKNPDTNKEEWKEVDYQLYDTTQTDSDIFYAYVFKLNLDSHKFKIAKSMPADDDAIKNTATELVEGGRYVFYTATDELKNDDSVLTYRVTTDNVTENTYTAAYNEFETRKGMDGSDEDIFALYFMYDTKVKGDGQEYTIRAGNYNISDSYAGFTSDIPGKKGINLFKETAKKYFTDPANYGMNKSSSDKYLPWSGDVNNTADDIDIMCDEISKTPNVYAKTSSSKRIGFRYNTGKGSDTLTLNQQVSLEAGTVTVAANTIDLNGHEFSIDARTIVFQTDTILVNGSTQTKISHGTYVLNDESSTSFNVKLSTTGSATDDWRTHYKLINSSTSALRGGYYIVPD